MSDIKKREEEVVRVYAGRDVQTKPVRLTEDVYVTVECYEFLQEHLSQSEIESLSVEVEQSENSQPSLDDSIPEVRKIHWPGICKSTGRVKHSDRGHRLVLHYTHPRNVRGKLIFLAVDEGRYMLSKEDSKAIMEKIRHYVERIKDIFDLML